ncbi:Glycerol-3-phosphate dehydrogenase, anaerobic, B subunit [Candidatus Magnetomorum sp. HK-1]|nr:Glycerol-3-phosphate dehydrogenase, anaerobic, B subunit [Candidatus Magnetomorum sp. HK-1]
MSSTNDYCDVLVIGSGMAGMASTFFALERGLKTIQMSQSSPLQFFSGFFDILGVHPIKENVNWENPWDAIAKLCQDNPKHPYAFLSKEQILQAAGAWFDFLKQLNLSYHYIPNQNILGITPIGSLKPTHAVPKAMWTGISAMMQNKKTLLVDIDRLKGFSARQIKENLQKTWTEIEITKISFPETSGEVYTGHMASALESTEIQKQLVETIMPRAHSVECIGFPAILGSYNHNKVCDNLEKLLGKPVFEIPTLPPSMPGIRLRNALMHALNQKGGQLFQKTVDHIEPDGKYGFIAHTSSEKIFAKNIILATGRFMGKGLIAKRTSIEEPLFNLPVYQPESRREWHQKQFLAQGGHDIHQSGIQVDSSFRPINDNGKVIFEHLFATGSILAHNNWMHHKCGSGVAIASAFAAVEKID